MDGKYGKSTIFKKKESKQIELNLEGNFLATFCVGLCGYNVLELSVPGYSELLSNS